MCVCWLLLLDIVSDLSDSSDLSDLSDLSELSDLSVASPYFPRAKLLQSMRTTKKKRIYP